MLIRKLFIFLAAFFFLASNLYSQNFNWITPGRTYLKMYLFEDGIYRINKTDFSNAGINPATIDPRTIKVIFKGSQIPIYFNGEQDGIFNDNDYFDFYGLRNKGGQTNTYNENNIVKYVTNEYYNLYSDTSAYWIDWNGANGIRFLNSNFNTSNLYPESFFYDTLHFEKDKIYSLGEQISNADYRMLNNEKFLGEGWFWTLLSNNQSLSDTFSLPLLSSSPVNSSIRVFAYPQNRDLNITNEHTLEVRVNGNLVTTLFSDNFNKIDTTINFPSTLLLNSSVNNVTLKYVSAQGFPGQMYIDLFEISYPKNFKLRNNKLMFSLSQTDTTSKQFQISGYNSVNQINIFDVRNNIRIANYSTSSDTLKFTAKSNAKIEIINDSIMNKPFRIKQRQVTDLVSSSNGVDYLIIYPSMFQSQAEQLRAYRQTHDGFRSFKAEIEDIYDIFYFGMENPEGLKNFTNYVYNNWQTPKLKYICLFGRGSLDPKRNSTASIYYHNFVPVAGNPNSDGYFANFNTGTFFYYDQVAIGRLPVYYPSEAQTVVDKIISYEGENPAQWSKTYSFITGGALLSEQQYYQQTSNFECNTYVLQRPVCGDCVKIYRTDSLGAVTFNYADSIKNTINRGTLFVNFRGHAGSHDWEIGMSDPGVLNNGNKLPIVLSLTCFTGENAKGDFRGFGEKFIYLGGKGAIGFVATTGWSFSGPGNDFGTYIIQSIKADTNRRLGDLLKVAGKSMSFDSLSFSIRHTVNCYNLLGDPAAKLVLPKIPEFAISENDYKLHNESITIGETSTLSIYPKNFGLFADSCKIRFQLKRYNQNISFHDTVYKSFKFLDTINYNFRIDSSGVYSMSINLDQDNWYPLENKNNNSVTINIPLTQNNFSPITPVDNSMIFSDSVVFSALNPAFTYNQKNVRVILELDTAKAFTSPVTQTFINNNISGTVTRFYASLPVRNNNTLYYWRTNAIINNDSSGWSKVQRFIYNNGITKTQESDRYINSLIPVVLAKRNSNQYSVSDYKNTFYDSVGVRLNEFSSHLYVRSYGSNGDESSYFTIGDKNIFIDGFGQYAGLNMVKVKKINGSILEFKNLKMNSGTSNDSLLTYLNTFDTTQYLMLLNAAYVAGGVYLNTAVKNKLRQFGSVYCDSIGLISYFHTWSFIGYLGASPSQVCEMFDPCCRPAPGCVSCDHWAQSTCSMNVNFKNLNGSLTNVIGPAQSWSDFSWNQTNVPNSSIKFDVIGISNTGQETTLFTDIQTNNFTDLSSVDAFVYPRLRLLAKFNIDSVSGTESPALTGLQVNYVPAAELILDRNSLQVNTSSKSTQGLTYSFDYHNAGYSYLYGIVVNVYNGIISDSNLISTDTVQRLLKTDSTFNYSHSIPGVSDTSMIYVYIKPNGRYNEFYTFNNFAGFKINPNISKPETFVEVISDGKKISSGDFVNKKPEIKINLTESKVTVSEKDTTSLQLLLNDNYIPYYIQGNLNPILKVLDTDNKPENQVSSLIYYPELENGKNKFTVVYKNAGETDTINYDLIVTDEFSLSEIYNYPNPMKVETNFIFNLNGLTSPENLKIKIYTVGGRLIKEIEAIVNSGYNQIPWDGKDSDGDFVANGTYFYKLIFQDKSKTEPPVQKLVVLR